MGANDNGAESDRGRRGEGVRRELEGAAVRIRFESGRPSRTAAEMGASVLYRSEAAFARMRYEARLDANEADLGEVRRRHEEIRRRYLNPGKRKNAMDVGTSGMALERARAVMSAGGDVRKMRRAIKSDLDRHIKAVKEGTFFMLKGEQASADDPELRERQLRTLSRAAKRVKDLKGRKREDFVREFAKTHKLAEQSPEEVAATLLVLRRQEEDAEFMATALNNDRFAAAFVEQAQVNDNPEEAFMAAIEASPELMARYRLYTESWQAEDLNNVFMPAVPGAEVTELEETFDARSLESDGVVLDMGGNNKGEVHFGDLTCDVEVYNVNGQPKVFIYNEESDRGVTGPFDPDPVALHAVLGNIVVDEHFGRIFRRESVGQLQNDPTAVPDKNLFGIVHAVAPEDWGHRESWTSNQLYLINNLAKLFASPDATVYEKVRFFEHHVLPHGDRVSTTKRMLYYAPLKSTSFKEFAEGLK